MAGKKKNKEDSKEIVVAQYKIFMHCDACERNVAKAISSMKGQVVGLNRNRQNESWVLQNPHQPIVIPNCVEKFITDMRNHKVVITGSVDAQKVLKKLKKKTGKRVELLVVDGDCGKEDKENNQEQVMDSWLLHYYEDGELHMMFNDENANSCFIM